MDLETFRLERKLKPGQLAEFLGYDDRQVRNWRTFRAIPSPDVMKDIAKKTEGLVQPQDFVAPRAERGVWVFKPVALNPERAQAIARGEPDQADADVIRSAIESLEKVLIGRHTQKQGEEVRFSWGDGDNLFLPGSLAKALREGQIAMAGKLLEAMGLPRAGAVFEALERSPWVAALVIHALFPAAVKFSKDQQRRREQGKAEAAVAQSREIAWRRRV